MSEAEIRQEKARAQELRKSQWWKRIVAKNICYYCQGSPEKGQGSMDHIVPLARGGKSTKNNVVFACKSCNTAKSNQDLSSWFLGQEHV